MYILNKSVFSFTFLALISAASYADSFQSSASFSYADFDNRYSDGSSAAIGLTVYAEEVSISKGPLALAGFLNKASGVSASFTSSEYSGDFGSSDSEDYRFSGSAVTHQGLILGGGYNKSVDEGQDDYTSYLVRVGAYLDDVTTATFSYSDDDDFDGGAYSFNAFRLSELNSGKKLGYGLNMGYLDVDEFNLSINMNATYYINNRLGITGLLGYSHRDFKGGKSASAGLQMGYFIRSDINLSAGFHVAESGLDISGSSTSNVVAASITTRF